MRVHFFNTPYLLCIYHIQDYTAIKETHIIHYTKTSGIRYDMVLCNA